VGKKNCILSKRETRKSGLSRVPENRQPCRRGKRAVWEEKKGACAQGVQGIRPESKSYHLNQALAHQEGLVVAKRGKFEVGKRGLKIQYQIGGRLFGAGLSLPEKAVSVEGRGKGSELRERGKNALPGMVRGEVLLFRIEVLSGNKVTMSVQG